MTSNPKSLPSSENQENFLKIRNISTSELWKGLPMFAPGIGSGTSRARNNGGSKDNDPTKSGDDP